jgi:hypothetical protein
MSPSVAKIIERKPGFLYTHFTSLYTILTTADDVTDAEVAIVEEADTFASLGCCILVVEVCLKIPAVDPSKSS